MANRYWVGGSGDWNNDDNHWATSSGGSASDGNLPTSSDDVFIDSNSGFGSGGTINITFNSRCNNFTSTSGHSYSIDSTEFYLMSPFGSISLESGITVTANTGFDFYATSGNKTITTNGANITDSYFAFGYNPPTSAIWTLQDNLEIGAIDFYDGTFDANDKNITTFVVSFNATSDGQAIIYMGSGTWKINRQDSYEGSVDKIIVSENDVYETTIYPETSTIEIINDTNYEANISYYLNGSISDHGKTFNNIILKTNSGSPAFSFLGSFTFNEFSSNTNIFGIKFLAGSTTTVSSFDVSGSSGNLISINSDNGSGQFNLSKSSGTVDCDYLDLSNSNSTGGATWYAGSHSNDTENNDGWIFEDAPTTTSIKDMIGGFIPFAR